MTAEDRAAIVAVHDSHRKNFPRFVRKCCQIENKATGGWEPFDLWPAQEELANILAAPERPHVAALKARQVGFTWEALAYGLWDLCYVPGCLVLLYSYRDTEAIELMRRITGMAARLPAYFHMKPLGDKHHQIFPNGSEVRAFPTTAGDSYTARLVVVDEADIIPNLNDLLGRVKPTIDNGGQLVLVSRADKKRPVTPFKSLYTDAKRGVNSYRAFFAPWHAHPNRDQSWYDKTSRDYFSATGSNDQMYEQYPATDDEALSARELDKRYPPAWVKQCYTESGQIDAHVIPGWTVYEKPDRDETYVIGVDVAEGDSEYGDYSAAIVMNSKGEECACFVGRLDCSVFAAHLGDVARQYGDAALLVERNNHGHLVIARLRDADHRIITGRDGKLGWHTNAVSKADMCQDLADHLRDKEVTIKSRNVYGEVNSIELMTLSAPEGLHDDLHVAFALACLALRGGHYEDFLLVGPK